MKKFIKHLLPFLLAVPLVWFLFICCWGTFVRENYRKNLIYNFSGYGFLNTRLKEADTVKNTDLLIIGSSHAYRGFDTRIFKAHGINAFNLGSSSQSPIQSRYLLRKYLHKVSPKIVLFEVGFMTFSSDGLESGIDIVSNINVFDKELYDMITEVNDLSLYNTLAYSFYKKRILHSENNRQEKLTTKEDIYIHGGYVEHRSQRYNADLNFIPRSVRPNINQQRIFEGMIEFLKQNNVKVILVQAPVVFKNYRSIINQSEFNDYFNKFAPIPYLNFNSQVYDTTGYFYDNHHLNQTGVERFNADLLKMIKPILKAELSFE
jgi:hypothetical protein